MVSAATTSGLTTFNLDVDDIIEQAMEPLGGEYTEGADMLKARRVLNLLLIQLQNKNIPLNKIEAIDLPLIVGTDTYILPIDVVDVLELNIQKAADQLEIPVQRWGVREYHQIPNKTIRQRPTLWTTDRQEGAEVIRFWPVPDVVYTAKLLTTKRVEDVTASYQKIDLAYRYLPLLIKWLSYELSLTRPGLAAELVLLLKEEKREAMEDIFEEDRERVDFKIVLGGISGI